MLASPAFAQATSSALSPDGKDACFGRVYDAAHLKTHPNQKIARIFFLQGNNPVNRPMEEADFVMGSGYTSYMTTTARGADRPEWVGGWCGMSGSDEEAGAIHCGMECDRTMAQLKLDAKGSLIVSSLDRDIYLDPDSEEMLGKAGYEKQRLGSDDNGFRLDSMPVAACAAEFAKIDPVDAALGDPLRVRLKPDQPFCFGRDYSAAHLGSHADQMTQAIRVYRGKAELAGFAASGKKDRWPNGADITVSIAARQGTGAVSQTYSCEAEGDQWRCAASDKNATAACDVGQKEIYLRRGVNGTMMLANPNSGLALVDLCSTSDEKTASDDRLFRLDPMPQSACGL
ncbi:hypothetical protein [Mesorhizobium sp. A556]